MKHFIFFIILLTVAAAVMPPAYEISFITHNAAGIEYEYVISWATGPDPKTYITDNVLRHERYLSIERYIDNDINDSFYIGIRNNFYVQPYTGAAHNWTVFLFEVYKNTDEIWANIEIGL